MQWIFYSCSGNTAVVKFTIVAALGRILSSASPIFTVLQLFQTTLFSKQYSDKNSHNVDYNIRLIIKGIGRKNVQKV